MGCMDKKILIGTSGWSYDDWVGNFYPSHLKRNEFLLYYSQYFNVVEINFTYYSLPNKYVLRSIARNVPFGFEFTIKLHSSFTHQVYSESLLPPYTELPKESYEFLNAIDSMRSFGSVNVLLGQFPQSFAYSESNLDYIVKLKNFFKGYVLAIEFRNNTWVRDEVFRVFEEEGITFVSVDEPDIRGLMPREFFVTNRMGYIRFHSRDATKWYKGEKLRYDYLYSEGELLEWVYKIKSSRDRFDKLYVFFNNCHNGQAVTNALQFKNYF